MNKLKRVLSGTLALVLAVSAFAACGDDDSSSSKAGESGAPASQSTEGKTEIKVYTFTDETKGMLDGFIEANPDFASKYYFTIDLTANATADYIAKVASSLSGADAPDLFLADADYAQQFAALDGTAKIADLGITVNEDEYYKYTLDFVRTSEGLMGLSHQAAPGAVFYRTDYAKDYLGVETPEAMQEKMSTWAGFLEVADTMKENGVYMVSGIDELKRCFMNNRKSAWVDSEMNYVIDEELVKQYLETTKTLSDKEETQFAANEQWQPDWYAGMKQDVFCYFGCTWYLHYTIKPNSLVNLSGTDADGNKAATDADFVEGNGSFGKWNMIEGPMAYFWGGTWWYGSDNACKDEAKKAAVAEVINWFCVNDESMTAYAKKTGDFASKKAVVNALKDEAQFENPFLGGQNHYQFFAAAAEGVDTSMCTQYDDVFNTAINDATLDYVINGKSMDDVLAKIKTDAQDKIEGLK